MAVRQQPRRKQFLLKGVKSFDGTEMVQVKNRSISVKDEDSTEVEKIKSLVGKPVAVLGGVSVLICERINNLTRLIIW